jgi:hypothetical protein
MWKKWKFLKYRKPTRSALLNLGAALLIITGVTILFFGTPVKPTPDEANRMWTFAAPFLAGGVLMYVADVFIKR